MVIKFSRAQRRHDSGRLKKKRKNHWGYGYQGWRESQTAFSNMPPITLGIIVNTPTPCSCWMCGNPRRIGSSRKESLTIQELKADDIFKGQLNEISPNRL